MKVIIVSDLFDVLYGVNLELNKFTKDPKGINFVSRTARNNGVSTKVCRLEGVIPNPPNTISVAGGGSVMESFLQPEPYYSGRDLYYLKPKTNLSYEEMLYYCVCLRANKYRYNYGRQANRTLKYINIPDPSNIPSWIYNVNLNEYDDSYRSCCNMPTTNLNVNQWAYFNLGDLFDIKKGIRLTKQNMSSGNTPFIGSIAYNNGYREFIGQYPIHKGNTISVNYNGSVAEAFYQPNAFWASDDVNVLYPNFDMNKYIALFIASIIKLEKFRFNYGRKWHLERMKKTKIKVPSTKTGEPDYKLMEMYIKSLPFSKRIYYSPELHIIPALYSFRSVKIS